MKTVLLFLLLLLFFLPGKGKCAVTSSCGAKMTIVLSPGDSLAVDSLESLLARDTMQTRGAEFEKEHKKLIAAVLAFPVPFGFLGLHRLYLGTAPWVPLVYLGTLGGGLILPLIDFIQIVMANDEEMKTFEHNENLFMWIK